MSLHLYGMEQDGEEPSPKADTGAHSSGAEALLVPDYGVDDAVQR